MTQKTNFSGRQKGQTPPNNPGQPSGPEPWKPKTPAEVPHDPEKKPWNPTPEREPVKPEVNEPGKPDAQPGPEPHKRNPEKTPPGTKEPEKAPQPEKPEKEEPWSPAREPQKEPDNSNKPYKQDPPELKTESNG